MNLSNNGFSARLFAVTTIVSLLLSALPVAFFVAEAASTVFGPINASPETGTDYASSVIDASTFTNLSLNFDYDLVDLDTGDTLTFGWKAGVGPDNDFAPIAGVSADVSTVVPFSISLPVGAQVADLTVYFKVISSAGTDTAVLTNIEITGDVVSTGTVRNVQDDLYFATIQEAVDAATTADGETIELTADSTTLSQTTINKEVTLDGNGYEIDADFAKTSNSNNSAIGVQANNVTIRDIKLTSSGDKPWPEQLHGINVYSVDGVILEKVEASDFAGSGILVNSSEVTASDLTTDGNGWHGINVDQKTKNPAKLTISKTSSHGDLLHLYVDDSTKNVTVVDVDSQYATSAPGIFPGEQTDRPNDVLYTLKKPETEGCTDKEATNYDPKATKDDGSCEYPEVDRCIDVNLLLNGSFERPEVTNSSKWQKFGVVPGWTITKVSDDAPTTLELMRGIFSNDAADGEQYVELDGDHSTKVSQTATTLDRGEYELSWAFAGRHNAGDDHNQMDVLVNGVSVATEGPQTDPSGLEAEDWARGSYTFVADSASTMITFADLGPSNSYGTYLDDAQLCLTKEPEPVVNVHTTKIVCTDEADLPNWGKGGPNVTETTATDWMAANKDSSCKIVDGWEFEWADRSVKNPGNAHTGTGGADWTTFTDSTLVPLSEVSKKSFWMREVLPEGYIPFKGGKGDDVSAELYCHIDGLNYDNYDRIDGPKEGEDYYCVAWNVPEKKYSDVTMCKYDNQKTPLSGWQLSLLGEEIGSIAVQPDGTTQSLTAVPAGDYVLKADGAYEYRGKSGLLADARFSERKAGDPGFGTYPDQPWREASATTGGLAVQVNADKGILWGSAFSPAHVYYGTLTQAVLGDVNFYVYDNVYTDNKGEIAVTLYQGFTGVTGKDGCVTFEDVPYGEYQTDELLQAGWENLDGLGSVTVDDESEVFTVVNREEVEYGPYCGDGEVNQLWEQCDGDDGLEEGQSCTDYCTLDNQCSAEQLIKITLDDTDSTSFDGSLHLDMAGNIIPNGTWFSFQESIGNDTLATVANAVSGLAIKRDNVNGKLEIGFVGGNGTKKLDIAAGTIMTKGIDLGGVDRELNPQLKLEDGTGGSFDDVFDKNPDQSIDFDLRADTGSDGVSVEINAGENYDCPDCKATVEARVVLNRGQYGTAGDGDLSDEIILGDTGYSAVEFGEWFPISEAVNPGDSAVMIADPNTVTNFDAPADKAGLFVSRENGTVKVALYGEHNSGGNNNHEWIDARIEVRDAGITNFQKLSGQFKFENHPENNGVPTNDGFDAAVADGAGVDFKMWVDTASDGFKFDIDNESIVSCDDDTEDTMIIDGYKFEQGDDYIGFLADWVIELYDENSDVLVATTSTNDSGYYSFEVPVGDYDVYEVQQTGWMQASVEQNGWYVDGEYDEELYCEFDYGSEKKPKLYKSLTFDSIENEEDPKSDYRCNFYNKRVSTYRLDGYKHQVEGEVTSPKSGWTIYATNGDITLSTTTDELGYFYFDVSMGGWEVYEEERENWAQVGVKQGGFVKPLLEFEENEEMDSCRFKVFPYLYPARVPSTQTLSLVLEDDQDEVLEYESYRCDFINEYTEPDDGGEDDGGGSGGSSNSTRVTNRSTPTPLVLGASTDQCPFLTDYMQMGTDNDPIEVMKLQLFLNIFKDMFGGAVNPVTGTFGATTDANIKALQEHYRSEILDPWYEKGIVPHNRPTGFVYKTTLWKINDIVCGAIFPSLEGETLNENIDIDAAPIKD